MGGNGMKVYDCPIKIRVTRCIYAWTIIECDFNGEVLKFNVSQSTGAEQLADFVDGLLMLSGTDYVNMDYRKYETEDDVLVDEIVWDDVCTSVSFLWDEEPAFNEWRITRKSFESFSDYTFPIEIKIKCSNGDKNGVYIYNVKFNDLCYALAKCLTDVLKKYGFEGYCLNTYGESIDIRKLLKLKRFALGIEKNYECNNDEWVSGFAEEIELLLLDM